MADASQSAATPAPKGSFVSSCADAVAGNAYLSLAVMVVLTVLLIGLWVYYHGIFGLGPYASGSPKPGKKASDANDDADPETERLIKTINQK
jgi:hypothetical protein